MKRRGMIEKLWAEEKYKVMMHSQKHYNLIREELKKDISIETLEILINDAFKITPESGAVINTADHMWGYFKKVCTAAEKNEYMRLKEAYKKEEVPAEKMLAFIRKSADKYEVEYLQKTTVLHK